MYYVDPEGILHPLSRRKVHFETVILKRPWFDGRYVIGQVRQYAPDWIVADLFTPRRVFVDPTYVDVDAPLAVGKHYRVKDKTTAIMAARMLYSHQPN